MARLSKDQIGIWLADTTVPGTAASGWRVAGCLGLRPDRFEGQKPSLSSVQKTTDIAKIREYSPTMSTVELRELVASLVLSEKDIDQQLKELELSS